MPPPARVLVVLAALGSVVLVSTLRAMDRQAATGEVTPTLHSSFIPNHGQWSSAVRFAARGDRGVSWSFRDEAFDFRAHVGDRGVHLRFGFVGALSPALVGLDGLGHGPGGEGERSERHHFFVGRDEACWARSVPGYETLRYRDIYPGIDVVFRSQTNCLRFDVELGAQADVSAVRLAVEGARGLGVDGAGVLILTDVGDLRLQQPVAWYETSRGREPVDCAFRLIDDATLGFSITGERRDCPLVIDPTVEWSTLLGGSGFDEVKGMTTHPDGSLVIGGLSESMDFDTTPGVFEPAFVGGFTDAFVSVFSAKGELLFSTYLGGSDEKETVLAIDVAADGTYYLGGHTFSTDFPTTPGAFDDLNEWPSGGLQSAASEGVVVRLSADGSDLLSSTLIGGLGFDVVNGIAVHASGEVTVAGSCESGYPTTTGAFQELAAGLADAFVTRVSSDFTDLVYSTLLGGVAGEQALALTVDSTERPIVVGGTQSVDFPATMGAFDDSLAVGVGSSSDGFVAKLSVDGSAVEFATYLGGIDEDRPFSVDLGSDGSIYVAGRTRSADFPVTAFAYDGTHNGEMDGFVSRLSGDGSTLIASTYLGGSGRDEIRVLSHSGGPGVHVTGGTCSLDFPVTMTAFQPAFAGGGTFGGDALLARFDESLATLTYATYLGGTDADHGFSLAVDPAGIAAVSGFTFSTDFPTSVGAYDTTYGGGLTDVFVTRIDTTPSDSSFVRADANGDQSVDIADGIAVLTFLFSGGGLPCLQAGDANESDALDLGDPIHIFTWAFSSGPPPPAPFPNCGPSSPSSPLSCFDHPCP